VSPAAARRVRAEARGTVTEIGVPFRASSTNSLSPVTVKLGCTSKVELPSGEITVDWMW
jgi:hypothetical protein